MVGQALRSSSQKILSHGKQGGGYDFFVCLRFPITRIYYCPADKENLVSTEKSLCVNLVVIRIRRKLTERCAFFRDDSNNSFNSFLQARELQLGVW